MKVNQINQLPSFKADLVSVDLKKNLAKQVDEMRNDFKNETKDYPSDRYSFKICKSCYDTKTLKLTDNDTNTTIHMSAGVDFTNSKNFNLKNLKNTFYEMAKVFDSCEERGSLIKEHNNLSAQAQKIKEKIEVINEKYNIWNFDAEKILLGDITDWYES